MGRQRIHIDQSLIDHLDRTYPNRLPTEQCTPFEYGKLAGKQELIEHIKGLLRLAEYDAEQSMQSASITDI